ncbi:hypothetical protein [Leptospira stimsonii]|nr:hypothetical protein [Leptospira stimsonii]
MEPISNQYDLVLFVLLVLSFGVGMFAILYSKNESVNRGILLSTSTFGHKGLRIPFELLESFVEYFPYFAYLFPIEKFEKDDTFHFTMNFENIYWINEYDQEVLSRLIDLVKKSNGFFLKIPCPEKKKRRTKKTKRR